MPHPRGGPCDNLKERPDHALRSVSMPHPRGGPCDVHARRRPAPPIFVSMPHPRGGPCDLKLNCRSLESVGFLCRILAAVPATIEKYRSDYEDDRFLCRILAAVPATEGEGVHSTHPHPGFYAASSRRSLRHTTKSSPRCFQEVSMPHPRGGPCDVLRSNSQIILWSCFYAASSRRSLRPRRRRGPIARTGFYAASSRRSLRLSPFPDHQSPDSHVSMPHPRGGPCDVESPRFRDDQRPQVSMPHPRGGPCDDNGTLYINGEFEVSMPHPRGGPCDPRRHQLSEGDHRSFYAASSRRSLRRSASEFLCRILAAVPATQCLDLLTVLLLFSFYAASSRRSLRLSGLRQLSR